MRNRIVLISALGLVAPAMAQDAPATKPEMVGYRTVQNAATREIVPPKAGQAGRTGYLGLSITRDAQGKLVVEEVQPESPAARAGVVKGDMISSVDGESVKTPESFRDAVQMQSPGEPVKLAMIRDGKPVEITATLASTSRPRTPNARPAYLGLALGEAKEGDGVPIERVEPESPAAAIGFKPGDLIMQVEGIDFTNPGKMREILIEKQPGQEFEVMIRRDKEEITLKPKVVAEPANGGGGGAGRPGRGQGGPIAPPLWTKPEFRLAVIGIEYPDVKHNAKRSTSDWDQAILSEGSYRDKKDDVDDLLYGSLNDYLIEQSAGGFHLKGKVFDWIEVGKKRTEYILGSGTTNIRAVMVEALEKVVARDGKDAFKDFDGFLFLYAGEPIRGNRGSTYSPHAGMIPSFESKRWPYLMVPEGGAKSTPIGGFAKEFALMLGLPDLAARTENRGSEGLGVWSLMSIPTKGNQPQHLDAWSKEKLGWLKPTVVDPTVAQKLVLAPVEGSAKECFKVLVRPDGSEYFLLENRRKTGFDSGLPAEGLLIWRVVRDRPLLEESHGVEGPTGPTVHLDAVPYPSPSNHAFTTETTPSSRSPLGGGFPVSITNIRRLPDGNITFQIGYEYH